MKVVGYLRVSTREQADDGYGLDAQRRAIQAEADRRGWDVTWIEDEGYTARRDDRPGLLEALDLLRRHQADALVISKLDRLSRSSQHFAAFLNLARKQRWAIVALDMNLDMTTTNGRLVAHILAAVAEWESNVIGDRTADGMAEARAQGRRFGRERQASDAVVRRIVRARNRGGSFGSIAARLTATKVPTPGGAAEWHPSTVRRIYNAAQRDKAA